MKVYGTSEYKGYLIKRDPVTKKAISKHYISAIDRNNLHNSKLSVWFRDKDGDSYIRDYEIGQSEKVDNAIRAWYVARKQQKKSVPFLAWWQRIKLFKKKK